MARVEESENDEVLETEEVTQGEILSHKEKRHLRIKKRLFKENDIKYEGPLSYRYLRVLAWICLALGQIVLLNSVSINMIDWDFLGPAGSTVTSVFASLSTPFFIIASFGLVLSGRKNIRDFVLIYFGAYFAVALGFIFFYMRYVNGLFVQIGIEEQSFIILFEGFLAKKVQVNVFADLFAFALFHFFLNYTPKHVFKGKNIIFFRLLFIIPILFVITSYVLKVLMANGTIQLSFYFCPFFTTKSPFIYLIFIIASLWLKNRERWFIKLGASKEEYKVFVNTNRNSLSLSVHLSIIIVICVVLDLLVLLTALVCMVLNNVPSEDISTLASDTYGLGQSVSMILAIPFLFLYSYKREHKDSRVDLIIPMAGIGLIAFVYVEIIYQFILKFTTES